MKRNISWLLYAFLLLSVAHLAGVAGEWASLRVFTKPVLLPLLAVYFWRQTRDARPDVFFRRGIFAGLLFSAAGDTFLLFPEEGYFLLGLGSFLLAHVCYLSAFLSLHRDAAGRLKDHLWVALPLLVYLAVMAILLWPGLGGALRLPVLVYATVITAMALGCLNLWGRIPAGAFRPLFAGVLFFLASDSILAIDRFRSDAIEVPLAGLLIMVTYLLAQFLIVRGSIGALRAPVRAI